MKYTLASNLRLMAKKVFLEQEIVDFIKKNPNPTDEQVHKWAEKKGHNAHRVETTIYKLATKFVNFRTGGLSNKKRNFDRKKVDPAQLRMGIKVEYEHTPDRDVAEKIALDHLAEALDWKNSNYYSMLKEMEDNAK